MGEVASHESVFFVSVARNVGGTNQIAGISISRINWHSWWCVFLSQ